MSARLMGWAPDTGRVNATIGAIARLGANTDNEVVIRVDGVSRNHVLTSAARCR